MNKNIIQFIVDEDCNYVVAPSGTVKAHSNLTTRIQLITPISASVAVNYVIYDSRNIQRKQYLVAKADKASTVVDPNNPNYKLVAGWNIYEADIYAPILSAISRFRTGRVGVSFEFVQQVPNALCTNFIGYFGHTKDLPETANNGDYYICEDYNFWIGENLYNKGDILVWYNGKWNNGGILPKGLTETVDISVDPAISYPTEEVDETAFGIAIGEIGEDVAELDTRLNGVETNLNDKQDKTDLSLDTASKTVVGAINEVYDKVELVIPKANGAVRFDITQTLSDSEKSRARINIGVHGDGTIDMVIVNELPEVGDPSTIYLLPNENPESSNLYTEWVYINEDWEMWGVSTIDLSDYISYTQDDSNAGKTFVVGEDGRVELVDFPTISVNGINYLKDPDKTYLVIKTPADNDTFTLQTGTSGSPNYTIEWGDGTSDNIIGTASPSHEYATAGMYLITISGNFENGVKYWWSADENKNKIIEAYGGSNYPLAIENGAFNNCTYLTTASFPRATSVVQNAFSGCSSLIIVDFPKVTSIGISAFSGCSSLTTVNFPKVTSIGQTAFYNCYSLITANFPNVTTIGINAFKPFYTSGLKELTIGNVTTTGTGTRFENVKLTNLTIAQDATDADIERITTFFKANGGTFIGNETKHGLQVEKTPDADNDVLRKVDIDNLIGDIDLILDNINGEVV